VFLVWGVQDSHIDIVAHKGDVIENIGEPRHIGHRLTISTNPEIDRNGGADVEVLSRRLRAQFPEEGKEVVGVGGGKLVTIANTVWRFPTRM